MKQQKLCLWIFNATIHQLEICEILIRVWIKESFRVVAGILQNAVHLFIKQACERYLLKIASNTIQAQELTSIKRDIYWQSVIGNRINNASSGDLCLQQSNRV